MFENFNLEEIIAGFMKFIQLAMDLFAKFTNGADLKDFIGDFDYSSILNGIKK